MGYAAASDVTTRAGVLSSAWDSSTTPSLDDLDTFAESASAEIDAALGSLGIAVPVTDALAMRALMPFAADVALLMAIDSTWPGGRGSDDVAEMRKAVAARVAWAWARVIDEKSRLAVVAYLLNQLESGSGSDGRNFWTDESTYPTLGDLWDESLHPGLAPGVHRGMRL